MHETDNEEEEKGEEFADDECPAHLLLLPESLHLSVLHGITQFVSKVNKNLKQFFTKMENIKFPIFPVL